MSSFQCRVITAVTLAPLFAIVGVVGTSAVQPVQDGSQKSVTPPTVLFLCPHGAAKSVLASAYFQRAAKARGLNVHVLSAGTDPDAEVAPAIAGHLRKKGYDVPVGKPRRATAEDMARADVVVSIGCDLKDLPAPRGTLVRWDDVPAPSEAFARADEEIRERVIQLLDELIRQQKDR